MGSELHLICNATGLVRAPDAVDWFKDGQRIHPSHEKWSGRIEVVKHESFEGKYYVSELIIEHSAMEDNGHYVCRSTDLAVSSIKIHILNGKSKRDQINFKVKTQYSRVTLCHLFVIQMIYSRSLEKYVKYSNVDKELFTCTYLLM